LATTNSISAIAVAPSDSNVVYIGYQDGFIARTSNALDPSPDWTLYTGGLYDGAWVSSIAVDPGNPDIAYCTYSNYGISHVFRKAWGSRHWTPVDGSGSTGIPDIPAHWVAVRPCNAQQLYVGTELGVFASDDGGTTWAPVNNGLAHTIVETLDFKDENTLVAFTHGRGTFLTTLETCEVEPIPTVSEWGILCMALLLIGAGVWILDRRGRVATERIRDERHSSAL
jgi:hypothetical protein